MGLTAAFIVAAALAAAPQQDRPAGSPRSDQTVPVTKGTRLVIDNMAGEVLVRSWDRDELRVQARHSTRTTVRIRPRGTNLVVDGSSSRGPTGSIDYEITAPTWMAVKIDGPYNFITVDGVQGEVTAETVRGDIIIKGGTGFVSAASVEGEVIVEGARGRINVSSVNEGVTITGASGEIVADSVNGSIRMTKIESSSVEAGTVNGNIVYEGNTARGGKYRFTTHNGNVTVAVPDNADATFTVRTYQGSFNSELPAKCDGSPNRGKRTVCTMGNGNAEFELESFGGSIRLRKPGSIPPPKDKKDPNQ
jgi:DUF4097 and DUF4098 domain-containing protein YvlB